jgi:hypothetical protein
MGGDEYNPNSHDATFARMEAKLDQLLEQVRTLEPRVSVLEQFRWYLAGVSVALTLAAQFVWEWIKSPSSHH